MVDRTGEQIGNYRLIRLLGSGGFAEVYLGQQIYLDSAAAIKLMHTNLAHDEWEGFRSEARTLVNLVHPHIIRLLDFGRDGNTPFLVMDYAPNGTLRQRIQRGERLPLATVVDYTNQIASALQYAHNEKIIHRDIKPENMLVGKNDEILLTDFGIAIVAASTRTQFTQETVGTIAYMAPEQIQAHPRAASDQYSLAVVVYEWLTGSRPFSGAFTELAVKHMMVPPPPLHEAVHDISPDVERVVLTALEKDPKQRFGSVQAFAMALERAAKDALAIADQATILPQPEQPQPARPIPPVQPAQPLQKTQLAPQSSPPPIVVPNPVTPVLPILPANNPPSNPGAIYAAQPTEIAPAIDTPDSSRGMGNHAAEENQATALVTPESQPVQFHLPIQQPPQQASRSTEAQPSRQPQPAPPQRFASQSEMVASSSSRSGVSRRAFLFGGLVTAGVVVAGGITYFATRSPGTNATTNTTTGQTILAQDNFRRNNQQFWGTASDGQQWRQDAATSNFFSIINQMGQIQVPANANGGELTAILGQPFTNGEAFVTGTVSDFTHSQLSVILRWTDNNHYYKAFLQGGAFTIIKRMNAITPISQNKPFTTQPGVSYSIRFRIVGNTMEARAWQSSQQEPTTWNFTITDNNQPYASGNGGIRANVSAGVTVNIGSFELQTATGL